MHNNVNKLIRWKLIIEEYKKHVNSGYPLTRIHKVHIYPKFFISLRTLHTILATPIDKELKEAGFTAEEISGFKIHDSINIIAPVSNNPYLNNPYLNNHKNL